MPATTSDDLAHHVLRGGDCVETVDHMRGGAGTVTLRRYRFGGAPAPANFVVCEIPPGAEEGQHTHFADDRNGIGAYDEFYYVIAGRGLMTLGESTFELAEGDGVHAPLDLPRGIRNCDSERMLKVQITYIQR